MESIKYSECGIIFCKGIFHMKICSKCKEKKENDGFSKGQKSCKECYRKYYLNKTKRICLECRSLCIGKRHSYCSNECKIIHNTKKIPNGCWEWKGAVVDGYGQTNDYDSKYKNIRTHRLSYRVFKGEIPQGLLVLHACDNRKCVNPKHLFLGTHHDNNQDCLKKGRWKGGAPIGEKNGTSKLKEKDIIQIRQMQKEGVKQKKLGEIFGVSQPTISSIINLKSWK